MANEELGLRLTAQITEWLANLTKAGAAADGLKTTVLELEQAVKRAFAGIEAISRQSGGKMVGAFVGAAREMDKATDSIEADAKRTVAALGTVGKAAIAADKAVNSAAGGIANGTKKIGQAADDAGRNTAAGLGGVEAAVGKVGERIRGSILNIQNALLGLGALRFGQAAVGAASDFEAALGQLAIVASDTGVPIAQLRQQLLDLSKTTPLALGDLTKAYATAVGSLPKGANQAKVAFEALNAAQQAARASGASTEETLRGITALLNTYGDEGLTAAQITDKLFATFDQGAATVPELSASIGQVAGIAKGFGITIDEVFGSIAVLTRGGQTGSEAITNLRQALISTANGGAMDKVATQLKELGLSAELFSAQSLRKNGLIGVLEQVEAAGGKPVLNKLFTDTQGLLAVQTLLSKGLKQTRDDIERIGDSAGKTDAAVALIGQNFDQLAGIAKNRLGAALIEIGERVMPTVIRVLNELADYAETNGTQIADSIGKAVDSLVKFGEWAIQYGPLILKTFIAFKGVSFFAGLATDIAAAVGALATFNKGFAASQAIGQGMAALGGTAAASFDGGFSKGLKGLGGTLKAAFSSPGVIGAAAAAATIGYTIGTELMEALGDAIEAGTQREIVASIDALDQQISARLKALGARSVEEAAAIRRSIVTGEAVQTAPGKAQTLAQVQSEGGGAATQAAFNKGLAAIAAEVTKAQAGTAESVARMQAAAAKIEDLQRSKGSAAEIASAEAAFTSYQAVVQSNAKRVEDLTKGSAALVAQYTEVTQAAAGVTDASGKGGVATVDGLKGAGKKLVDDSRDVVNALIAEYEAGYNKLRELQLQGLQLSAEAAQNEADARRQAYENETDARVAALENADVAEKAVAELRTERERGLVTLLEAQIGAAQKVANARIEQAKYAAEKETEAFRENATVQAAIAANLATEEATIQADLAARTEEIRRASAERISAADRAAGAARLAEATRNAQRMADVEREASVQGRAETLNAGLSNPAQGALMAQGIAGQLGASTGVAAGIGGAVAVLPAISAGAGRIGDVTGGDVEGLRKKARDKEAESDRVQKQIEAIDKAEVARKQASAKVQEQADALRNRADEISAKAREDGISKEEKKRLSDASAALRAQAAKLTRGVEGADAATAAEKQSLQERLQALQAESKELRDRAEAAKGELETFFEDLFSNLDRAIFGIVEGLPQAIDRILTQLIPNFIEHIIASLPEIVGKLIILLPRIAWSLVKELAYYLPIAIYDGIVQAGEAMIEFFTTGVVKELADGIADVFSAAGTALVDAIIAVFDPIIEFFKDIGEETGDFFGDVFGGGGDGVGSFIGRTLGTSLLGKLATGKFSEIDERDIPIVGGAIGFVEDLFHQGGTVGGGSSNPHMAAALASAGAQRFANGGMVAGLNSLARRRMSQLLNGDDVPAILAPGEGVLTAQGVDAVGGPVGVDSINRGNPPGGAAMGAQVMISARLGGDRALAAFIARAVSVSVLSPAGNVRAALDQSGIATSVPAYAGLR